MADFDTDEKCEAWIAEHSLAEFRRNATAPLGFGGTRRIEAQEYLKRLDAQLEQVAQAARDQRADTYAEAQARSARLSTRWTIVGVIVAIVIGVITVALAKGWL